MKAYTHIYLVSTYSYYATLQSFWCIPNPPAWFYPKLRRLTILDIETVARVGGVNHTTNKVNGQTLLNLNAFALPCKFICTLQILLYTSLEGRFF